MNVLIIGYGKMGREIEHCLTLNNHHTSGIIDNEEHRRRKFQEIDVAIEFSSPDSAVSNILWCLENNIPVVSGTTGWLDNLPFITEKCQQLNGSLLWGSNFSIGMNVFFKLNIELSHIMDRFKQYSPLISETHHIHKLDKPSGTAITLAEDIIHSASGFRTWVLDKNIPEPDELPVHAFREGEIHGIHEVTYSSDQDVISIRHEARSRQGFALGAIMAAEWLINKKGVYSFPQFFDTLIIKNEKK